MSEDIIRHDIPITFTLYGGSADDARLEAYRIMGLIREKGKTKFVLGRVGAVVEVDSPSEIGARPSVESLVPAITEYHLPGDVHLVICPGCSVMQGPETPESAHAEDCKFVAVVRMGVKALFATTKPFDAGWDATKGRTFRFLSRI